MKLTDCPREILDMIPYHLDSHADLYALSKTCRTLNITCSATKLAFRADYESLNGKHLQLKHHAFVANITAQLAEWAEESEQRKNRLVIAVSFGMARVLDLARQIAWITLKDLRTAQTAAGETETFLDKLYAKENSRPYREGRDLYFGDGRLVAHDVLLFIVYCALFRRDVESWRDSRHPPVRELCVNRRARVRFLKAYTPSYPLPFEFPSAKRPRQSVQTSSCLGWDKFDRTKPCFQRRRTLIHFWRTGELAWDREQHPHYFRSRTVGDITFVHLCEQQGWPSMLMLLPDGMEACRTLLQGIRADMLEVLKLDEDKDNGWFLKPNFIKEFDDREWGCLND